MHCFVHKTLMTVVRMLLSAALRTAASVCPEFSVVFGQLKFGGCICLSVAFSCSASLPWLHRKVGASLASEANTRSAETDQVPGASQQGVACRTARKAPL